MKNIICRYAVSAILTITLFSCDKGFEEININPNASTSVVPEFLFTGAQLSSANYDYNCIGGAMQHMANWNIGQAQGDKYMGNTGWEVGYFQNFYTDEGIETQEVINAVSNDPNQINKLAVARIWRAYIFHRTTDMYGDIPYTDAFKGASDKIYTPKYDTQKFIYSDMLKELEEAANSFDPSKPTFGKADLIYGGSINQWKKFAYSLMLRLGMHLTKVDVATAEIWVKKAIAGGVIVNDNDLAAIQYVDGGLASNRNPWANNMMSSDYSSPQSVNNSLGGKLSKTLIDYLKNTRDPRLNALAVVWVGKPGTFVADTATALQKGMQNGIWDHEAPDFGTYSEPNPLTMLKFNSPMLMFTSCESNLLLAEAALRGWYTGSAEAAYINGVKSGIKQWALYGPAGVISDGRINTYLARNPFNTAGSFEQSWSRLVGRSGLRWLL